MNIRFVFCICFALSICHRPSFAENWPRYRGADGSGISSEKGIPTQWSEGEYAWVTTLPGEGHSSPAIWGKHLFVTSATDEGLVRHLFCLDAESGEIRWCRSSGFSKSRKHGKNSFASSSPATDGTQVYVAFADQERFALAAYDFDGTLNWRTWLGPYNSNHGLGASPLIFEDLVIMANDQDGPSSVVACDRRTGRVVWNSLRSARETSYATPLVLDDGNKKPQLICLSGATGLVSLDPWTGDTNWFTGQLPQRTVASPTSLNGWVYGTCGQGGKGTRLIGVDPSGKGNVAETHIKFQRDKELPYVPILIGYQDHLYLWNDNGVILCIDPKTNKTVWQERIGGNYSGSPICVDGKIYCIDESGKVMVVAASPKFQLLGENSVGDPSHSTPAIANGRLYLRSFHKLSCLSAKSENSKTSK